MSEVKKRGFAAIDPSRQREIASAGGKAAHASGRAHKFTPEEAKIAGAKGGSVISRNREHMSEIGRLGGVAKGNRKTVQQNDVQLMYFDPDLSESSDDSEE